MAQQMRVLMPPTPAAQDPVTTTLADICRYACVTVPPTDNVEQAVRRMPTPAMRLVPVVDGGQLVDMVSLGNLAGERDPDSARGTRSGAPQCRTGGRPAPPTRQQCLRRMQGRSLWKPCGKRPRRKNTKLA
jgi:CBS-domain-containing membrane protein